MSAHTPGPWAIDWNVSRLDIFSADAATLVATLRRSALSPGIDGTAKANARLIAAAPDMLDSLLDLVALLPDPELDNDSLQREFVIKALAAIAKATGEAA